MFKKYLEFLQIFNEYLHKRALFSPKRGDFSDNLPLIHA